MTLLIDDSITHWDDNRLIQALAALPTWRREEALRYHHTSGRVQCAASYLLLCRALREDYGIEEQPLFQRAEHGKPTLLFAPTTQLPHPLHFNMSHCRHAVAVVVSEQPVGIDIETRGRYRESLAEYVCSESELQQFASASGSDERDALFTRLWTQKEATAKLLGCGLSDRNHIKDILRLTPVLLDTREEAEYVCTVATMRAT